jgi:DNA adenine methylase
MKPLLKWAGGKHLLAPRIASALGTTCQFYHEPFLGSAAVFLHLKEQGLIREAVLSDGNRHVANFHRVVRDTPQRLIRELQSLPTQAGWESSYYETRSRYNEACKADLGVEHAAMFLWLNRACYNGLHRENRRGEFNVPVGKYKVVRTPTSEHIQAVSRLMAGTTILHHDFRDALNIPSSSSDKVYCDPPYVELSKTSSFGSYSAGGFGPDAQQDLVRIARRLAAHGTRVVLSNHDVPAVRELYVGPPFTFEVVEVKRSISSKKRGSVPEVIIIASPE